ncbi:2-phosphosulfolactate phosphatase [Aeromicrobium alkaliterrae]|uniref:Probable 2-phosphosulfolactate phosphatase n=1 Tax=Aeromicrobium alkaliterrae TaxID=302168 RepID=A0ABP4W8B6_9ACTN
MDPALAQLAHTVRFEWGTAGAAAVADGVDVAVVVDVLHATTAVAHGLDAGSPVWAIDPADPTGRLAHELSSRVTTVVAGSLHNARAVADWLAREHDEDEQTIAVIAAGDLWPDGSLRPAVEDLWGAGAILAALEDHDWRGLSPEAAWAADSYRLIAGREESHLVACAGGQLCIAAGEHDALHRAADLDGSLTVPLLGSQGFVPAP